MTLLQSQEKTLRFYVVRYGPYLQLSAGFFAHKAMLTAVQQLQRENVRHRVEECKTLVNTADITYDDTFYKPLHHLSYEPED